MQHNRILDLRGVFVGLNKFTTVCMAVTRVACGTKFVGYPGGFQITFWKLVIPFGGMEFPANASWVRGVPVFLAEGSG